MSNNFAITFDSDGSNAMLHAAFCPEVRRQADAGKPVLTLFDCERAPPDHMPKHSCLSEQ